MPGAGRPLTVANTPLHMAETPGGVRKRAPLAGEHTDRVLAEFGFAELEVALLRKNGIVL
jgi:formyl-CoA transferase